MRSIPQMLHPKLQKLIGYNPIWDEHNLGPFTADELFDDLERHDAARPWWRKGVWERLRPGYWKRSWQSFSWKNRVYMPNRWPHRLKHGCWDWEVWEYKSFVSKRMADALRLFIEYSHHYPPLGYGYYGPDDTGEVDQNTQAVSYPESAEDPLYVSAEAAWKKDIDEIVWALDEEYDPKDKPAIPDRGLKGEEYEKAWTRRQELLEAYENRKLHARQRLALIWPSLWS